MRFWDIFNLAFRTIRSNKLRTGLTVSIIAFGIMALVGIITAIKAMNQKFSESFSSMGANAFTVRFKERNIRFGNNNKGELKLSKKGSRKEKKSNLGKIITKDEAELFVNGKTVGIKKRNGADFPAAGLRWSVVLNNGINNVKVIAKKGKILVENSISFQYQTQKWDKPAKLMLEKSSVRYRFS